MEYISGRNSVREALIAGTKTINKILLSKQAHGTPIQDIIRLAKEKGVPMHHVPPERLDKFSEENNQGVVAEVSNTVYLDLDELWEKVKGETKPLLVVMDGIEDPHNVGAIIRSAVALGANGIILGKWRSAGLTETVSRSSAGAIEHIPVARVTNIAETINRLKEFGVWIYGAENGGKSVSEEEFSFPMALVIGSEGQGLHRLVKERCDFLISIPQTPIISSLNASCASAIILHEIFKKKN
ncbi:MAG TPA: 23S rRNA (guanosine(2251)-2'-O)-methyltransferase RlmB [Elusimicrobia bacterium]|nr:MAG: 23S rRNA (guanosine(2251)-2'-O)-methyltransferase RlmB [Elusimicrobia bacterium RIFOXYA12_FULL_49_49]OGS10627.1 MAG: 23S rRNA (guanosine(2251)-2'-O)-methyltransferase RlmB [Elusimicrobia bacterium RIFOXYB1_FULL_48_9]OGS15864.1 MAG: 23S rRNA (guanosine(2251)-2'-O)-methyltransferase RlmB [Elusimicrobia bacterium RIFOXYA2_FULL_47_53]OGS27158.1 MAG: 23S rRNA (guanosine(2251)-2'-O)-methyltransferase RlmB [Elusimicrobia bacterium RIFOXYB12_FULL_50_12]OGS31197.1 MAG: 23S rRNA (guanosine(2251)-